MPEHRVPGLIAREIGMPPPPEEAAGHTFELDGGMVLRLVHLPDESWIALVPLLAPAADPRAGEEKAHLLMRLHLARMAAAPGIVASMDASGECIAHTRLPEGPDERVLAAVESLLNEAEALRKGLEGNAAFSPRGGFTGGLPGIGGVDLTGIGGVKWM